MPIIISSDYIASIEESASVIESEIGTETVDFVFRKFGANSVEDLESSGPAGSIQRALRHRSGSSLITSPSDLGVSINRPPSWPFTPVHRGGSNCHGGNK